MMMLAEEAEESFRVNRGSHSQMFFKMMFLKISQISQENTCVGVSF